MNIRIAREGVEIGECDREDLEQLARENQLQLTDHYWHEGMEDWQLLGDLLGADPLKPKPDALSIPPLPVYPRRRLVLVAIGGAVIVAAGLALYLMLGSSEERVALPYPMDAPTPDAEISYTALRTKAIADLNEKFTALPRTPAPPSNAFYYDFSVKMPPAPGLLAATISGTEDIVDPGTHKTILHTTFVLRTEYSRGRWNLNNYRASKIDLRDGALTEVVEDENTAVPSSLVYLLGMKTDIH